MFLSVLNPCKNFTRQSSVVFCFILQQVSVISYVLVNTLAICLTHRHMGVSNINMVLCERVRPELQGNSLSSSGEMLLPGGHIV